ncbi:MAG: hypothetical protein JSW71_09225 [Gemmatimonadota bacterium]|nr:MAG: hypothetical protein JSW71_09225 [Gemmatimonadota bacterium]
MEYILKTGSFIGLALTVVPAFLVFAGELTWDTHAVLMAIGALLWFATAPFWMVKEDASHGPVE